MYDQSNRLLQSLKVDIDRLKVLQLEQTLCLFKNYKIY